VCEVCDRLDALEVKGRGVVYRVSLRRRPDTGEKALVFHGATLGYKERVELIAPECCWETVRRAMGADEEELRLASLTGKEVGG